MTVAQPRPTVAVPALRSTQRFAGSPAETASSQQRQNPSTEPLAMTQGHLIRYNGMPRYAHSLVECLEAEGVQVSWLPPPEVRGGVAEVLGALAAEIVVTGPESSVYAGVDRFRSHFPGKGRVDVDEQAAA